MARFRAKTARLWVIPGPNWKWDSTSRLHGEESTLPLTLTDASARRSTTALPTQPVISRTNQNNFNGIVPWTQEHPVNDRPRIVYGDSRNTRGDQDRWLEDGSFFRISDITLGYSLPTRAIRKIGLEKVRFAVTGKNLVTFTKYSGLDPEFADGGIWTIGYDGCSFPNPRAVQFAVSLTF